METIFSQKENQVLEWRDVVVFKCSQQTPPLVLTSLSVDWRDQVVKTCCSYPRI